LYTQHLSSLQFLSYAAFGAVVLAALWRVLPGRAPPVRVQPYSPAELAAHDRKLPKYFLAGAGFLVLGGVHMVAKNLPWAAEWLARAGYPGHLVRDLSNTHVMIVGGGTLVATGLCWYVLPRATGRPLASEGLAQCAFWFTAAGLLVFYVALVANGIAMGRLVAHGWEYQAAKEHMGKLYRVPVGMGAGVMGVGYWCFAANVFLSVFHARLVRVPKPQGHLAKFFLAGAAGLTVGTVQGVIQVQPAHADWLYRAGHAGEWIDPISHAHVNLVTGLTMLVAGALFGLVPAVGGRAPSRRLADGCFYALLGGSLVFYESALYLGLHEGRLVVDRGLTPEQAEAATPLHAPLIVGSGVLMFAAFWFLLGVVAWSVWPARGPVRALVLAGCGALAVGTLQGPVQAFPEVHELLERGGDAGEVIVNLHAQLNMLGGLMAILVALSLALLWVLGWRGRAWPTRALLLGVGGGMGVYYAGGVATAAIAADRIAGGATFGDAVAALEPWQAMILVPAALAVLAGFGAYGIAAWQWTRGYRSAGREALRSAPARYTGRIPRRVRTRRPAAVAVQELPMGLLGFPGVGWLFAGFPVTGTLMLLAGPAVAWALIPLATTPFTDAPLRTIGWQVELAWLPASTLASAALLYRAHRKRRLRLLGPPRSARHRGRVERYRTRVSVVLGAIALLLVSLPFVPAVAGVGGQSVRYAYQTRFTREVTGQFLATPKGTVKLFAWSDPQSAVPSDALRLHASDVRAFLVRAAAVDRPAAYQLFALGDGDAIPLAVRARSARQLVLAPGERLAAGRYLFVASHEGMFGGRDFSYLTVVGPGAATTAISSRPHASAPAIVHDLLPVGAALVAALFAALLLRSFRRRPAGQKLLWAAGFALFTAATAAEAIAARTGWSPWLFRAYYLAGGVLTVAYLGAGSAWLLLRPRGRDALLGALLTATAAAAVTVALAPVDAGALSAVASGRPPANGALGGNAFLWAIALNSLGTLVLVGGSALSIVRRVRVRANVWIGGGALVVALATGLSRAGNYSLVYVGELVGIALMFSGFTFVGSAAPRRPARERPVLQTKVAAQ
jgi:hypothetical protein